jgi:hypothetical protein
LVAAYKFLRTQLLVKHTVWVSQADRLQLSV